MAAPDPALLQAVIAVVAQHFRVPETAISGETTALDVDGWDSMTHTLLLMRLEKALGVRIDKRAGFQAANVAGLALAVEKARNPQP